MLVLFCFERGNQKLNVHKISSIVAILVNPRHQLTRSKLRLLESFIRSLRYFSILSQNGQTGQHSLRMTPYLITYLENCPQCIRISKFRVCIQSKTLL